ncbi:MAG: hypothetical protein WD056_00050 [Gemmatimonadota bacterium]
MLRYAGVSVIVVGGVLAVGWPLLNGDGRRGLLIAVCIALVVQWGSFAGLAALRPGSGGYLALWVGGTLVRLAVIGAAGFTIAAMEGIDLVVALLALAGLFFVLLLLEPWALRDRADRRTNG